MRSTTAGLLTHNLTSTTRHPLLPGDIRNVSALPRGSQLTCDSVLLLQDANRQLFHLISDIFLPLRTANLPGCFGSLQEGNGGSSSMKHQVISFSRYAATEILRTGVQLQENHLLLTSVDGSDGKSGGGSLRISLADLGEL